MPDTPRRPIDRDDFARAGTTVYAMQIALYEDEQRPLWEVLRDLYQDHPATSQRVTADDLIGDEAANREVHHALIVLERLAQGHDTIADRPVTAIRTVCATPGCPGTTHATYCVDCQWKRAQQQPED